MRGIGLVVCLSLIPWVTAHGEDELSGRLANMPANHWMYANPKPSKRLVLKERKEGSPVEEITSREPAFREYTSPAWGDGEIIYFGGGHSGYFGNDVEAYDPATNAWRQLYRPVCPPKDDSTYYSGGSERCYVDPKTGDIQPYVLHGYARTAFDPALHRYVCTATFATKVERDAASGTWRLVRQDFCYIGFDLKTAKWEMLAEVPDALKPGSTSLSFDPELGGMIAFGERAAYVFRKSADSAGGKWQELAPTATRLVASGGAGSVFLPEREQHLVAVLGHGGAKEVGTLGIFSTREKKSWPGPVMPKELAARVSAGTGGYNLLLGYDSIHKKVVAMSAGESLRPDVWTYDPATGAWQSLPVPDSVPKLVGVFEPGRGRSPIMFDAKRNVFFAILRRGDSAETWAYRLEK